MKPENDLILKRSLEFEEIKIGNDSILLPLHSNNESNKALFLNSVALRIWKLLIEARTIESLINIIIKEYDVEREDAETDIINFTQKLIKLEAIKIL